MTGPVIFDSDALAALLPRLMDGHVTYLMRGTEGKVDDLTCTPDHIQHLDCSGLVEYVFYQITNPGVNITSGSANQEDWFRSRRYPRVPYSDAGNCDSILRVAFRDKRRAQPVRHVWFIVNGQTIESTTKHGSNGPVSLRWDERVAEASDCFQLGVLLPARLDTAWILGAAGP